MTFTTRSARLDVPKAPRTKTGGPGVARIAVSAGRCGGCDEIGWGGNRAERAWKGLKKSKKDRFPQISAGFSRFGLIGRRVSGASTGSGQAGREGKRCRRNLRFLLHLKTSLWALELVFLD